ncbi:MAG: GIY-YIG nuclease family protein [Clostridium butyricum]|nr:GIY-YIG nuclease family protein [Clostridium butyricum]
MNYVYIVKCSDGTLYTGWTNNLDKRIEQHCNGTGAKYTRGRGPVRLVYHEEFKDKRDAMRREYEIKRYSRINKLKLIENMQKYDKK